METIHRFNEREARLIQQLAAERRELLMQAARVEMAIQVALSAICASHGLEGEWRLADDCSGLVENTGQERAGKECGR